jgi:hypothetical protein
LRFRPRAAIAVPDAAAVQCPDEQIEHTVAVSAMTRTSPSVLLLLLMTSSVSVRAGDATVTNRSQLTTVLSRAQPGDTILIAPGAYRGGLSFDNLQGTADRPIVIAAADPDNPPIFEGGGSGMHLSNPAHLELRNLVFSGAEGNGLNIDDGGAADSPAHHVSLIGLVIRDVGPRGNRDGIKLSGVDDFQVLECTIERWGDGGSGIDMVGCHDGEVIACRFLHEQADQANGVQTKGGSRDILIKLCRFDHAGGRALNIGGSTGLAYFRPRPQGYEAKDITVEDCAIIGSSVAFVGVDGAVVRHNTIYRPERWAIRILQEMTGPAFVPCRNGRFENNIIAFHNDDLRTLINIGGGTAPESFSFTGNAWYCIDRPAATRGLVQLPVVETDGVYGVNPEFADAEAGDLRVNSQRLDSVGCRTCANDEELQK